ncbi:hypothetical protein ACFQZS_15910 [Mucilaginibacter calamicampi]|uniref:Lipoprotein n=1 Tax=Mucilaginibacter calamicampi TaxID=1302352 RepID=A0ABW2YZ36_9SPHI
MKLRYGGLAFCLLLFASCYSNYKAVAIANADKQPVALNARLIGSTVSLLPKPRAEGYTAYLEFENKSDTSYRISNLHVSLKNAFPRSETPTRGNADTVIVSPGGNISLKYDFYGKSRLFPHKVAVQITGDIQQGNQMYTLAQMFHFKRYMYVNVGGI